MQGERSRSRVQRSSSSYQLNRLGSKAASDSTLKQLTLAGYQILVLYFTLLKARSPYHVLVTFGRNIVLDADRNVMEVVDVDSIRSRLR